MSIFDREEGRVKKLYTRCAQVLNTGNDLTEENGAYIGTQRGRL